MVKLSTHLGSNDYKWTLNLDLVFESYKTIVSEKRVGDEEFIITRRLELCVYGYWRVYGCVPLSESVTHMFSPHQYR